MRILYPYLIVASLALSGLAFQNCSQAQFSADNLGESPGTAGELGGSDGDPDSGNPGGGGNGGGSSGPGTPISEVEVEQNCRNRTLTTINTNVSFATPPVCAWGQNDNLTERNGYAQARSEQEYTLPVPSNAVICKLEFNFPSQAMLYDDEIIMTYNQYVLASSYKGLIDLLPKQDGLYYYQWSSLKGRQTDVVGYNPYIAGQETGQASVQMPRTETTGQIRLTMDELIFYKFAAKKMPAAPHKFGFVTTGDNDSTDCQHLPVNFAVKAMYYVP